MNNLLLNKLLKKENLKLKAECVIDNKIDNIIIKERIGTESVDGEAYLACYPKSCKLKLAIKKIPVDNKTLKNLLANKQVELKKSNVYSELLFMKLSKFLVDEGVTIHLPIIYNNYLCENACTFTNSEISSSVKNCIVMVSELADGDLKKLINEVSPSINAMKIIYFQIYAGLYCFHKYFKALHNDLHWGNVLYHSIPAGGYIEYIIKGKSIIMPNIGYIMVLWDFGRSFIPNKIGINNAKVASEDEDFSRITYMLITDNNTSYNDLADALYILMENTDTYGDFILEYGLLLSTKRNIAAKDIIATYNMDKKVFSSNKEIQKYISKDRKLNMKTPKQIKSLQFKKN